MDIFYTRKKKSLKSARSNTCCQLFVTDKEYLYVVPIRKESMKLFTKDFWILEAIIIDVSAAEILCDIRVFYVNIGTTLKILEESMPWANLEEV